MPCFLFARRGKSHYKKGSYSVATISFHKKFEKYPKPGDCHTSVRTGVAIPRLDVPLLVDKFRKTVQKNGLYDDGLPIIRWRFPHQCAHWFGMTCSDGPTNSNLPVCCAKSINILSCRWNGPDTYRTYAGCREYGAPHELFIGTYVPIEE